MTTVSDIYDFIDSIAPYNTQESWDNSGLNVGYKSSTVTKALLALDITDEVINEAIQLGAQLIITHHPSVFSPLRNITADTYAYKLINNNISALSAHTNYDAAEGGVNDVLCELLSLSDISAFSVDNSDVKLARIGTLPSPMSIEDLSEYISTALGIKHLSYTTSEMRIEKLAVIGGSGGEYFNETKKAGANALLTGEAKYHQMLDAANSDFIIISAGHYETEMPSVYKLCDILSQKFTEVIFTVTSVLPAIIHR